ncbi:DUF2635 domain-containing protein [Sphingomonas sp. AR_OL41]|uniref:DUF2635 domain-containing protein n=1 Tax=Sphingomonas sp. AR_OL41 TaxID=3042729 RepID=UPI0024810A3C|nr:DUF2635 domain-containing protein [Sphingomonas sp. AR_OL41]MDH7971783.1 DUF2635 domain-containing protein [Sphingomonas sp. AR_OL41]
MSDRRFIKPATGLTVHEPDGNPLPAEGKAVEWGVWWQRRLDQGDVEPTTEAAIKKLIGATDKGDSN